MYVRTCDLNVDERTSNLQAVEVVPNLLRSRVRVTLE